MSSLAHTFVLASHLETHGRTRLALIARRKAFLRLAR